jgi:hypothetical protein
VYVSFHILIRTPNMIYAEHIKSDNQGDRVDEKCLFLGKSIHNLCLKPQVIAFLHIMLN